MNTKVSAKRYFERLEQGDMAGVIALFSIDGQVHSPLYGQMDARSFYQKLGADTQQSQLDFDGLFEAEDGRLALAFYYHWTLASGEEVRFKVVDLLSFDQAGKIKKLEIIYDTVRSRELWQQLREK